MHDQYLLDFTSRANERCAKVIGLREAPLSIEMTRGRVEGVIELLQRLTLLCRDLPEAMNAPFSVDCQVMAIAARIERRKTVSEKTIRNWTADAKALGLLDVDYASQQYGGSRWNTYLVHFDRVLAMITTRTAVRPAPQITNLAGNGRKRPVTVTDPGAVTATAPNTVFTNVVNKHSPPLRTTERTVDQQPVVVSDVLDCFEFVKDLAALGMSSDGARGAVTKAIGRGLTHAQIGELVQLYREHSARDARMTAGWLYRWLTGQSAPPPKASGSAPKPPQTTCGGRGDGLSKQQVNRESLRAQIIRQARAAQASEDEIRRRCELAGVEY